MKTAILQVADSGPLESLVVMLQSVGYKCYTLSESVKRFLRSIGCDTVLDIDGLVRGWGYDPPFPLPEATMDDLASADLYVDVKAHRNGPNLWRHLPRLQSKTLWYRINGGRPEHAIKSNGEDCGDEANPPCPVLTPNQWYTGDERSYACWPPFHRFADYADKLPRNLVKFGQLHYPFMPPICLIHNVEGWGYRDLLQPLLSLGVRCYGAGSPDGLIQHRDIPRMLSRTIAMVHLKSSDAPGYALYEALAAKCPIVCTRRLIWRCRMQDLLIPGETCLTFDRETHDGLTPEDVVTCTEEIGRHLAWLRDPANNRIVGENGYRRLKEAMWSDQKPEDVSSLSQFMTRNFP